MKVIVLGAGVVGTACAWYLAKAGHEVRVIDRQEGARANVEAAGVTFDALFTVADLGITPDPAAAGQATLTLWPHALNANGMFIAAWQRKS